MTWIEEPPPPDPWVAGRGPQGPAIRKGEDGESYRRRHAAETSRFLLDPSSLEPGSATAQESYASFIKESVSPALRAMGFKGSGGRYRLERLPGQGTLEFQKSVHSNRALVEFTINVAANYGSTHQGFWTSRIGMLTPYDGDLWWRLPAGSDVSGLVTDVVGTIRDYALEALEAILQSGEYPIDPQRMWTLRFEERTHNQSGSGSQQRDDELFRRIPSSPDEAFSMIDDPDRLVKIMALGHLYRGAKEDTRLVPALIRELRSDSNAHGRSRNAIRIGLLSKPSDGEAIAALRRSAEGDEALRVRLSARYALALIERRQSGD